MVHLILGRSTVEVPDVCNTTAYGLARLTFVQDVKQILDQVASRGVTRPGPSLQVEEGAVKTALWRHDAYEDFSFRI